MQALLFHFELTDIYHYSQSSPPGSKCSVITGDGAYARNQKFSLRGYFRPPLLFLFLSPLPSLPLCKISLRSDEGFFTPPRAHGVQSELAIVFTALHVMQTRYSDDNSVRLSHT